METMKYSVSNTNNDIIKQTIMCIWVKMYLKDNILNSISRNQFSKVYNWISVWQYWQSSFENNFRRAPQAVPNGNPDLSKGNFVKTKNAECLFKTSNSGKH